MQCPRTGDCSAGCVAIFGNSANKIFSDLCVLRERLFIIFR